MEVVYKNAQGDPTAIRTIAEQFAAQGVDVIVPIATGAAQGAAAAAQDVPIVFSAVADPVAAGLVDAFDRTTGNITGVSNGIDVAKIFALADELTPGIGTYGFVYNEGEVNSQSIIEKAKAFLDARGLAYEEVTVASSGEVQQAARGVIAKGVDALFIPNDNTVASALPVLAQEAIAAGLPVYPTADSMVRDGGLATTGVNYTKLGELTAQAIGEYQKEFEENRLQLVLDPDLPRVQAFADGSKTYRVLENLLQNAKKYSAADSRVYVRVYKQGDFGVFEIKNISAQPLNISPQELTQRFVRGDASRTKEGNGLGLSIAQELCSAQQGKLELLIDGDLFKARVYLPQPKNALPQDTAE